MRNFKNYLATENNNMETYIIEFVNKPLKINLVKILLISFKILTTFSLMMIINILNHLTKYLQNLFIY